MQTKFLKAFLLYCIIAVFSITKSQAQYDSIQHDGIYRTYLLHLPSNYSETQEYPVVIAMHGGFGNAFNIENQSQLSAKADAEEFIVVYPEGVKSPALGIRTWNAGWCCGYASSSNTDDVGFIDALLDSMIDNYSVDSNRIFATGMSNGGFMSYRLACELSERIAAIAPVSCAMSMTDCSPERSVPIIHFHSYQDTSIPYQGGEGDGVSSHYNPPLDSVLNAWAEKDNCIQLNDTIVDNSEYTFKQWSDCSCEGEIQLYLTQDGGHSWHGGMQTAIGDPPSQFISATDMMWVFFEQYSLDCPVTTGFKPSGFDDIFDIYPNPTSGIVHIKPKDKKMSYLVSVFNNTGQLLSRSKNQTILELHNLPDGIYYISLKTSGNTFIKKVIKEDRE